MVRRVLGKYFVLMWNLHVSAMLIQQLHHSNSSVTATMFPSSLLQINMVLFHLPLHLTLPHMSSINILTAQPWAGKGSSPVSLLWTNPGRSYNPALKKEQLGGSQCWVPNAGQHASGSVLTQEFSSCEEPQAAAGHLYTSTTDTAWSAINWVTAFQTTSSLQSLHSETSTGKSAQVLITENRGQLLPVVWSEKIHHFKASLYRLTPERCWTSATSPENEGCKPLSTYLKSSNIDLLVHNYMIIQKFLIIWSFA